MNLLNQITANLTYNNFFQNVASSITQFTSALQGIALVVIIGCITIAGVMYLLGEEMSRKAKSWLVKIIIGAILIYGAGSFGTTLQDISNF